MANNELIHIDKDDDDGTDALFWADYLVDDDDDVGPLVLVKAEEPAPQETKKDE